MMSFYMKMKYLQNLQIDGNKKESNGTWEAREKNIHVFLWSNWE